MAIVRKPARRSITYKCNNATCISKRIYRLFLLGTLSEVALILDFLVLSSSLFPLIPIGLSVCEFIFFIELYDLLDDMYFLDDWYEYRDGIWSSA